MATPELKSLMAVLRHRFSSPDLLAEALVHRSVLTSGKRVSYERLEFLGDRVLGLLVAEMLYRRFPQEAEGALARRFTALVRKESLARVARAVGLPPHVVLSRGEEDAGGRENDAILSDVCEAVIGALYLDGGLEVARTFIEQHWPPLMEESFAPPRDAKTALQEWAQQGGLPLPAYETVDSAGPDHQPVFVVRVSVRGWPPQTASGTSKRAAAQTAAQQLLRLVTSGQISGQSAGNS